jgi:hypothetical protein
MSDKVLHLVSFDVPYPADYGGVIDVFHKLRHLHAAGVKVHLHCFAYGRKEQDDLARYCSSVRYYARPLSPVKLLSSLPFIVATRANEKLLHTLAADEHPVLFEGLHTCAFLDHPALAHKRRFVRAHNIEHAYYAALAASATASWRSWYFAQEASKLQRFEQVLAKADKVFAISASEHHYLNDTYANAVLIPPFHADDQVDIKNGLGNYALFHGNLSVQENIDAALFLVQQVMLDEDIPFVIAGKQPATLITDALRGKSHIKLIVDPGQSMMEQLISEAQVHVLPGFQKTGVKLKLIHALFRGRYVLVNEDMLEGTGLADVCHIAQDANSLRSLLRQYMQVAWTEDNTRKRKQGLIAYDNGKNVGMLLQHIWPNL